MLPLVTCKRILKVLILVKLFYEPIVSIQYILLKENILPYSKQKDKVTVLMNVEIPLPFFRCKQKK